MNQTEKSTSFIFATGVIEIDFFLLRDSGHWCSEMKFTTLLPSYTSYHKSVDRNKLS